MEKQRGFSLIELLIVVAIILIIAAIAIPNMVRGKVAANEASAASAVRSITTAQIAYQISNNTFAAKIDDLGSTGAKLLPDTIAAPPYQHSGYTFSTSGTASTFVALGAPITSGQTGIRSFCSDTPAVVSYAPEGEKCVPGTSPTLQ